MKKWLTQNAGKHMLEYLPRSGDAAIFVERRAKEALGDGVDHHVPRSSVEGTHFCGRRVCGNRREISDSADVLHNPADASVPVEQIVEERNQRRAFASGGHVGRTKVGNDRHSQPLSRNRAVARLPGDRNLAIKKLRRSALMIKRLAMAADKVDLLAKTVA